ncbi:hypothetical protein PPL_04649 [Heterostelium album PN500]|uniref:Uncharacterized protein n=1 Tax=Heterostelium pallidum (strain ATCC 26659 / Pp 5 / PN500) TaxID=670386 RepID=D3B858_HETP5|nr:hypothetical protein PPL_04649 [Heterostelium album PN500]EFA82226.1 hypothetical protein PPL_04649 [Heterostelium album PN500]|eukprot:XP_020434343.1 hypothetical protein PPL_04649 [Heterostelium album PN500]
MKKLLISNSNKHCFYNFNLFNYQSLSLQSHLNHNYNYSFSFSNYSSDNNNSSSNNNDNNESNNVKLDKNINSNNNNKSGGYRVVKPKNLYQNNKYSGNYNNNKFNGYQQTNKPNQIDHTHFQSKPKPTRQPQSQSQLNTSFNSKQNSISTEQQPQSQSQSQPPNDISKYNDIITKLCDSKDIMKTWRKYEGEIPQFYKAAVLFNTLNIKQSHHVDRIVVDALMSKEYSSITPSNPVPLLLDLILLMTLPECNAYDSDGTKRGHQFINQHLLERIYTMENQRMRDELFKYLITSSLQLGRYELALRWYARVIHAPQADIVRPICVFKFMLYHQLRIERLMAKGESASLEIEEMTLSFWNLKVQSRQIYREAFEEYKATESTLKSRTFIELPTTSDQPSKPDQLLDKAVSTRNMPNIKNLLLDYYLKFDIIPPGTLLIDSVMFLTDMNNHDAYREFLRNIPESARDHQAILFHPAPYVQSSLTDPNKRLELLRHLQPQLYIQNARIILSIIIDLFNAQEDHKAILFFLKSARKPSVFPFIAKKMQILKKFCQLDEDLYAQMSLIDQWVEYWRTTESGVPNEMKILQASHLLQANKLEQAVEILSRIPKDIASYRLIPKLLEVNIEAILRPLAQSTENQIHIEDIESEELYSKLQFPTKDRSTYFDKVMFSTALFRVLNRLNISPWLILEYVDKNPELFGNTQKLPSPLLYQMVKRQSSSPQLKLLIQYSDIKSYHEPLRNLLGRLISFNIVEINLAFSNFPKKRIEPELVISPENLQFIEQYHKQTSFGTNLSTIESLSVALEACTSSVKSLSILPILSSKPVI